MTRIVAFVILKRSQSGTPFKSIIATFLKLRGASVFLEARYIERCGEVV